MQPYFCYPKVAGSTPARRMFFFSKFSFFTFRSLMVRTLFFVTRLLRQRVSLFRQPTIGHLVDVLLLRRVRKCKVELTFVNVACVEMNHDAVSRREKLSMTVMQSKSFRRMKRPLCSHSLYAIPVVIWVSQYIEVLIRSRGDLHPAQCARSNFGRTTAARMRALKVTDQIRSLAVH